jgi:hypothetical protein
MAYKKAVLLDTSQIVFFLVNKITVVMYFYIHMNHQPTPEKIKLIIQQQKCINIKKHTLTLKNSRKLNREKN